MLRATMDSKLDRSSLDSGCRYFAMIAHAVHSPISERLSSGQVNSIDIGTCHVSCHVTINIAAHLYLPTTIILYSTCSDIYTSQCRLQQTVKLCEYTSAFRDILSRDCIVDRPHYAS